MIFEWLSIIILPLIFVAGLFYLKHAIPKLIESALSKELESYKANLQETSKKKEILSSKIILEFEQVLLEIGELSTYSFGVRMGVFEMPDAQYIRDRYYSLARFSATYWPYFECDLRQAVEGFINEMESCAAYDKESNITSFDKDKIKESCENLQVIIKNEIDAIYTNMR